MKFSDEEKREMLEEILVQHKGTGAVSREHGISWKYLNELQKRARVHGVENVLHKNAGKEYSDNFKLEVIRYVEDGHSTAEAGVTFNICDGLVFSWCRKYSEGGIEALRGADRRVLLEDDRQEAAGKTGRPAHTEKEFEELQRQLRRARMENEFLKKLDALVRERIERERRKQFS